MNGNAASHNVHKYDERDPCDVMHSCNNVHFHVHLLYSGMVK
jgi:hypothetical protein